jgi:LPS-assembly protein
MSRFFLGTIAALLSLASAFPAAGQTSVKLRGAEGEIQVLADRIEQTGEDGWLIATGNVEISRGSQRLTADRAELNRSTGEAVARGRVVFFDGKDRLVGDRLDYNFQTGTGVVQNASAFSEPYYRIKGNTIERIEERVYRIRRGVFTTCEADPPDWAFHAGEATVDLDEFVVGRDASFWVRTIPVIPWIPFFAAPIRRERQTGFLFPTFGNSSRRGVFAKVPYYWAISDSQDLTLSLDAFSRRGVGLGGEYRYILSGSSRGALGGFFIREFLKDDDNRGTYFLKHDWSISPRLTFKADINGVSSDDFFREYGDPLRERSQQRAESNLFLTQRWDLWSFVANAFWYQDLTTRQSSELQRLPELRLQGVRQPVPGLRWLSWDTEASFVSFVRDLGSDGRRLDVHPRLHLPISLGGLATFTPFAGGRATYYDTRVLGSRVVDGLVVEETASSARVRALAEWGADLETRASRVFDAGGRGGIGAIRHLIEPRVNYTRVTGVNRSGIPQFDPGGGLVNPVGVPFETDVGVDRAGRINALTYSVTNRLNAKTVAGEGQEPVRWELARFVLSQTYDLLADAPEPLGDLRAQLVVQPNRIFFLRGDAAYNFHGRGLDTFNSDFGVTIQNVSGALGTRFTQDRVGFVHGDLRAKLSPNVDVHGSTNWDTRKGTFVESRFGLNLHVQCWGVLVEYINRPESDNVFRFSVNLLGLGSLGLR